jgi:hypothetical protein
MAKTKSDWTEYNKTFAIILKKFRTYAHREIRKKEVDKAKRFERLRTISREFVVLANEFVSLAQLVTDELHKMAKTHRKRKSN